MNRNIKSILRETKELLKSGVERIRHHLGIIYLLSIHFLITLRQAIVSSPRKFLFIDQIPGINRAKDRIKMKLAVGQIAPDFTVPATYDRTITLSQYRGKNVVLVFFPQAWTPI